MKVFTLLASAGERPEWNDPLNSRHYRAIPLASKQFIDQFPMFSQLFAQFGVELNTVLQPTPDLLVDVQQHTYNVFYVPQAVGSPYVPVQREFVLPFAVQSVLGFGGLLPGHHVFAVILFSKVPLSEETANLFKTLALGTKLALLPFADGEIRRQRRASVVVERPRSRLAAMEQLLAVHEETVIAQAGRVEAALQQLSEQSKALRSVVAGTASTIGDDFFRSLVTHLASALKVRYALAAAVKEKEPDRVATLAVWAGDGIFPNFEYDLQDSPCSTVTNGRFCCYERNLQELFPYHPIVKQLAVESYCGAPLVDRAGKVIGLLAVMHDRPMRAALEVKDVLSIFAARAAAELERKRAETDLAQSLSLLRATLESTANGILVVDLEGRIVSFNRRFATMWRLPESVLAARDDQQALACVLDQLRDPDGFLAKVRSLYGQPEAESYDLIEFKDGRLFERSSLPQRIGDQCVGRVWSFRDITARKQMEERLRQAQKMEAIGRLAGGIAHDFNNLLTVIKGYSQLALGSLGPEHPLYRDVQEIYKAGERAAALTQQLLAFSRKQVLEPKVLDLNVVVANIETLLRRLLGAQITLITSLDPKLGRVRADPSQIDQVIMNLIVNARDAMPQGGTITIRTANAVTPAGACVMLSVTDTGCGMDQQTQSHLFEPFFTTKDVGQGTGLGLATVYGIIEQSGGHIEVTSRVGQGTTFAVFLPRIDEGSFDASELPPVEGLRSGSETILLVEDDPTVLKFARNILSMSGYRVLEATTPDEARRRAAEHDGPIDLLLVDRLLPGMDGHQLAQQITAARPATKVLFMARYLDDEQIQAEALDAELAMLPKPFSPDTLRRKVRELLGPSH